MTKLVRSKDMNYAPRIRDARKRFLKKITRESFHNKLSMLK